MLLNLFELKELKFQFSVQKFYELLGDRTIDRHLTDPFELNFTGKSSFSKIDRTASGQPKSHFGQSTGDRIADRAHLELSGLRIEV